MKKHLIAVIGVAAMVGLAVATVLWGGHSARRMTDDARQYELLGGTCVRDRFAGIRGNDYQAEQRRLEALITCADLHPGTVHYEQVIRQIGVVNGKLVEKLAAQ